MNSDTELTPLINESTLRTALTAAGVREPQLTAAVAALTTALIPAADTLTELRTATTAEYACFDREDQVIIRRSVGTRERAISEMVPHLDTLMRRTLRPASRTEWVEASEAD